MRAHKCCNTFYVSFKFFHIQPRDIRFWLVVNCFEQSPHVHNAQVKFSDYSI